jgi:hypothetical protein
MSMVVVQTFAMVGKDLDDAALCDMSVTAALDHPF